MWVTNNSCPCDFRLIAWMATNNSSQGSTLDCFYSDTYKHFNDGWEKVRLLLYLLTSMDKCWQYYGNVSLNTVSKMSQAWKWKFTVPNYGEIHISNLVLCIKATNNLYNACQIWVAVYGYKLLLESSLNHLKHCLVCAVCAWFWCYS